MLLFMIGTTTARDVDILIYNINNNKNIKDIAIIMGKYDIDYNIYTKDKVWYSHEYQRNVYWMTQAFNNDWTKNVNANELEDFYFNNRFNFYIHGVKCISLRMQIERLIKRNSDYAYVDLIGLTIQNNLNLVELKPKLCMPVLRLRQGVKHIITKTIYNDMIKKIKKYLRLWHNADYTLEKIKMFFPLCLKSKSYNNNLLRYNQFIRFYFLIKYCNNNGILLIIELNNILNKKFYARLNFNKILLLKSYQNVSEDIYNHKNIKHIKINSYEDWLNTSDNSNKNQILKIINKKIDLIIFDFTINYMIFNSILLIKNIIKISKKGTKVIVHCLDGNLINKLLINNDNILIYNNNNNKVLFTIYKKYLDTDEFKLISINNIEQYLVLNTFIVPLFIKYKFKLIEYINFIEHYDYANIYLESYEIKVNMLYTTYVFEYKS
jgi:hypothetical protein